MMTRSMWDCIQSELKAQIDNDTYNAWFDKDIEVEERKDLLVLWVPSYYHKDWIDKHFKQIITSIASKHNGNTVEVRIHLRTPMDAERQKNRAENNRLSKMARQHAPISPAADFLNPAYTFDNFVVGTSNHFAHAACLAVAEAPSRTGYNPLFLYGGSGLGKTHLMQAIGHHVLRNNPEMRVIYTSADKFTTEFINSLKDNRMDAFQKKYRQCELLLIDDIQFFANKDRSQEEFFHTFNELYESNRQLVISSDRTPRELPSFDDRLTTRLGCGLTTDIKPPNLETRIAILRRKADDADLDVPDDCLEFIGSRVRSNIRDLNGALMRVSAQAKMLNRRVDLALTQDALRDLMESHRDTRYSVDQIQKAVSDYFKVSPQEMKGKRRTSDVTLPRQVAMFICRDLTGLSLPVIGNEFGGRDHTTVLHSCKKIAEMLERDRHMVDIITDIKASLR